MKLRLVGRLTALTVCQAMSIAITVVLPAPVASFSASRARSGFACSFTSSSRSRISRTSRRPLCGATSVSQIAVSTASTWQKNGRMSLKSYSRQCFSRRAVSGVTFHCASGEARQMSTSRRSTLMVDVGSYCCSSVESPFPSSMTIAAC